MTTENPNWVPCDWTKDGVPYMWRRRSYSKLTKSEFQND